MKLIFSALACALFISSTVEASAAELSNAAIPAQRSADKKIPTQINAPDLDLTIRYYSKVVTPEGVLREARYEEIMVRRPGHVWTARILPSQTTERHDEHNHTPQGSKVSFKTEEKEHEHNHFNHIVLPRHVINTGTQLRLEYVDTKQKELIAIPAAEYGNVNFDGSWANTFFILDPAFVKTLPRTTQASPVASAQWHTIEKNGMFQKILWDEQRQIPLRIESGDKAGNFYRRIEVTVKDKLSRSLPWENRTGYISKEYSDFLD